MYTYSKMTPFPLYIVCKVLNIKAFITDHAGKITTIVTTWWCKISWNWTNTRCDSHALFLRHLCICMQVYMYTQFTQQKQKQNKNPNVITYNLYRHIICKLESQMLSSECAAFAYHITIAQLQCDHCMEESKLRNWPGSDLLIEI